MSVLEIKNDLLKAIAETDDIDILQAIQIQFRAYQNKTDWWENLSEKDKKLIEIGEQQIMEGKTVSHSSVRAKVDSLFSNGKK